MKKFLVAIVWLASSWASASEISTTVAFCSTSADAEPQEIDTTAIIVRLFPSNTYEIKIARNGVLDKDLSSQVRVNSLLALELEVTGENAALYVS